MFGKPPATVWENIKGFVNHPDKVAVLKKGEAFPEDLMKSFLAGVEARWSIELTGRTIPKYIETVKGMITLHDDHADKADVERWEEVDGLRVYLAKDTTAGKSLFTRLSDAIGAKDFDLASDLQIEMSAKMEELEAKYYNYSKNIL